MSAAERFRRIEALFRDAVGLAPEEREARVRSEARDDPELAEEVLAMLRADEQSDGAVDAPAFGAGIRLGEIEIEHARNQLCEQPDHIGPFRIIRLLGEGGMGVVYEAEQEHPRRRVALKVLRPGVSTARLLERFRTEVQILGRLQHQGIARILEAGFTTDAHRPSQPYFVMELVRGRALLDFANERRYDVRARLALTAMVCDAVHHAHQKGVIHRDLKPGNVLVVDEETADGERTSGRLRDVPAGVQPKVLDFGVARITEPDLTAAGMQTALGDLIGTVPYMSPEQAAGDPADIDARSDVYSLGVILFELLTGRLPHDIHDRLVYEAVRVIREDEPMRAGSIDRALRGDVETILGKALEKEKHRRYQSAAELARDIRRYLDDEPISARQPTAMYQFRKFARRNKAIVGGTAAALAAMLIGTSLAVRQAVITEQARREALRLHDIAEDRATELEHQVYRTCMIAASAALSHRNCSDALHHLEAAPPHLRDWAWEHLRSRTDDSLDRLDIKFLSMCMGMSADGSLLASSSSGGDIRVWKTADFSPAGASALVGQVHQRRPYQLVFSPDSGELRADALLGSIRLDGATLEEVERETHPTVARTADGRIGAWFAIEEEREELVIGELPEGVKLWSIAGQNVRPLRILFSTGGELLAASLPDDHGFAIHRVADGALLSRYTDLAHTPIIAFAPDDSLAAALDERGNIHLFDPRDGRRAAELPAPAAPVTALAILPGNERIATGSNDGTVRLWSIPDARELSVMQGNTGRVVQLLASHDGRTLFTTSVNGDLRRWDATMRTDPFVLQAPGTVYDVAISPDGERLATASLTGDQPLRIRDLRSGAELLRGLEGHLSAVAFSEDGRRLAIGRSGGETSVIRAADGAELASWPGHPWRTDWVRFDADETAVLSLGNRGDLVLHELPSGARVRSAAFASNEQGEGCRAAMSPDGSRIAVASRREIHLLDAATWERIGLLSGHSEHVYALAFDPEGSRLVSGSSDQTLRIWDTASGACLAVLHGHSGEIFAATFSPDGSRIASGGRDRVIRIWDAERFEEITSLHGHTSFVYCLAFSPDGRTLVSGGGDGTARLWMTMPLREYRAAVSPLHPPTVRTAPAPERH